MKTGITYLTETDWSRAEGSSTFMDSISLISDVPLLRLRPPEGMDEKEFPICLGIFDSELFLVDKEQTEDDFPWKKLKYQPFSRLSFLTLPIFFSSFSKRTFFEELPNYILSTQWKKNGEEVSSITLRPKKERVYFYLDAGEVGRVKIEKMTAESKVRGKPSVLFEYPIASVEPKPPKIDLYSRFRIAGPKTPYYCQRISVDGVPCEPMSWEEIQSIAKKVEEKVLALVIFQGWKGTELLFRSLSPTPTEEKEVFVEGNNGCSMANHRIKLQVVQSAYDSHSFLQAYFQEDGWWVVVEQICATPSVDLGSSALESLKKIEELWKTNKISILINGGEKAQFLLIDTVGQKEIFFPADIHPASERRYLPQEETSSPAASQEVELGSSSLEIVSYSKNSPKYASAKKKEASLGEDSDLDTLTLQEEVISLLSGQKLGEISWSQAKATITLQEKEYFDSLETIKKLFSNRTLRIPASLRAVGLFISGLQLKCLFSQRTIDPPFSIDELEQFFSDREISCLLNDRKITSPLTQREISILSLGPKVDLPLSKEEKERVLLSRDAVFFFQNLVFDRPLFLEEIGHLYRGEDMMPICNALSCTEPFSKSSKNLIQSPTKEICSSDLRVRLLS